jgi:hypothetical protein
MSHVEHHRGDLCGVFNIHKHDSIPILRNLERE